MPPLSSLTALARRSALAAAVALVTAAPLAAQTTTGSIAGRVITTVGEPLDATQVQVTNTATGRVTGTQTRADGRYSVLGLEVGGAYSVTARRIGYAPQTRTDVRVTLGTATPIDFTLEAQATALSAVTVTAENTAALISPTVKGTGTTISDTLIRRLPTLNRNFTDFVALTPQVSTSGPGLSGGGVSNRFNNIQIDGATERDLFGLGSTGQPGGQAGGKSIGIESVKEFQVLLAPFDVRVGQFAGLSVNAVTKSGTNEFSGSVYGFGRTEQFQREQPYLSDYQQSEYGLAVGGPIVKNRAFFFINPEFRDRRQPAAGPVFGDSVVRNLTQAQLDRFVNAIEARGVTDLGSAGRINRESPLQNVFARLDVNLPFNSSLVLRHNYAKAEDQVFSRSSTGAAPNFPLTSNLYRFFSEKHAPVAQLRTNFSSGAFNELIVGYTRIRDERATPGTIRPQISAVVPGAATLIAGTDGPSQANQLDQDIFEFTNNFTIPLGTAHRVTVGTQNQFYKFRNLFGNNSAGTWFFGTLDSLEAGLPRTYSVGVPVCPDGTIGGPGCDGSVRARAGNYSVYAQDDWTFSDRVNFSIGVRADVPMFHNKPPENEVVFQEFGYHTSEVPSGNWQFSPRLGFNWDVTGDSRNQLRGGAGMFQGAPAYVWLSNSFQNSGGRSGFASLNCNGNPNSTNANTRRFAPPAFTAANAANPPSSCAGGATAAAGSEVNLVTPDFRFPQTLRANLAFDREIWGGLIATVEGLYTKAIDAPFYNNIALADTGAGVRDPDGRFLYGRRANSPVLAARVQGTGTVGRNGAFLVTNQSKDYSYNLTGKLERRYSGNWGGAVAYTYGQAFDVQSLTSSTAGSQFRFGRLYSGRQDELDLQHSAWETPHRVVANGTYTIRRTGTSISGIYTGESGLRYAYVSSADINGDNQTLNDPVYIPTGTSDPRRPVFVTSPSVTATPAEQEAAFFEFIESVECLREQKGQIMTRNSCMAPWVNSLDVSVEQAVPTFRGQRFTLRLDAINFGNLINKDWGRQIIRTNFNPQTLYTQNAAVTRAAPNTVVDFNNPNAVPRVTFNPRQEAFNYDNPFSNYTFQLSLRYSF